MDDGYSKNKIKNGSTADGLTNWTTSNVSTTSTGHDTTAGSFQVNINGQMKQEIIVTTQPPDVWIQGQYLPDRLSSSKLVRQFIQVTLHYGDGTTEKTLIPCIGGNRYGY